MPPSFATHPLATSFGQAASDYRRHAQVQGELARWTAEWLPPHRTGRALEIGAGPGVFTELLLPWNGPLLATDLSPEMCAAGQAALPQLDWQPMRAEAPGMGPWDWILSSGMLQWAGDPAGLFTAWRDCLAPGGHILGGLFVHETLRELYALLPPEARPIRWRTVEEWRQALDQAGLRLRRDESLTRTFPFPSALELLRSLHAVGAAPRRKLASGALRRLLREYDARHRGAGEVVTSTWTFYRFEADRVSIQ